jgi:hypothetical protein
LLLALGVYDKYKYAIRFEHGALPPVDTFWSITTYDYLEGYPEKNPSNRYQLSARHP